MELSLLLFIGLLCISNVNSHSMLQCSKYDKVTKQCYGVTRNSGVAEEQESYLWTSGSPLCKFAWVNPITNYYDNGPSCPSYAGCGSMATYNPGEAFTMMWYARGHADSSGRTVVIYMSPQETANQGADITVAQMMQNEICRGPFANSENGTNGPEVPCTLDCQIPIGTSPGLYTLWWWWDWGTQLYASCAEVNVVASTSPAVTTRSVVTTGSSTSTSTSSQQVTTKGITSKGLTTKPVTTGSISTGAVTSFALTTDELTTQMFQFTSGYTNEQLCYKPGMNVNPNGPINNPPTCGVVSPNARCAEGQCCSAKGECGPTIRSDGTFVVPVDGYDQVVSASFAYSYYCDGASADYRKFPCSEVTGSANAITFTIFSIVLAILTC